MIQILPRNPGADNLGSATSPWGELYCNRVVISDAVGIMSLRQYNDTESTGVEPGEMKVVSFPTYLPPPFLVEAEGYVKITPQSPPPVSAQITIEITGGKTMTFTNTLLQRGHAITFPFHISNVVGIGVNMVAVSIDWQGTDFNVEWHCLCLRVYKL